MRTKVQHSWINKDKSVTYLIAEMPSRIFQNIKSKCILKPKFEN